MANPVGSTPHQPEQPPAQLPTPPPNAPTAGDPGALPPAYKPWVKWYHLETRTPKEVIVFVQSIIKTITDQIQKDGAKYHAQMKAIQQMWETGEYVPPDQ